MSKYDPRLYNGEALVDRVSGTLSRYSMCFPGQRVAVAVSGGADSVCLLHILHELAPSLGIQLSVAHLNHKLRGAASDGDAEFVRNLAAGLRLPFHYTESDVANAADNLEQAGRLARLAFFDSLPVDRVATGHTRSDQSETVLYRLLRGSGTAGLAGILPVVDGRLIRPLLECDRKEVLVFLRERSLDWREDATNTDSSFARNWLRHEILPRVRSAQPAVDGILARTAELARDEEAYWSAEMDRLEDKYLKTRAKAVLVNAEELSELPRAVQRRLIRRAVFRVKGNLREISLFHVEALLSLAAQREGHGRYQAPGLDVFRSFEWLRFAEPRTESRWERDYCVALRWPGSVAIPGQPGIIQIEVAENTDYYPSAEGYNTKSRESIPSLIDADRFSGSLELRNWQPGDQFQRFGHSIEKIKTLFQFARIPIWDRQGWPVITSGEKIVWTRRFGVSSEYAPMPGTRQILRVVEQETDSAESNNLDSASLY
jgi:tRNA(Ile)-lysidine synthase